MKVVSSGTFGNLHCQGIAVDQRRGYIYYSFTTKFVKSDMEGNILGTVEGIVGHLGCIDFHEADGRVYASLEYKNDEIGRGVRSALGIGEDFVSHAFYVAIFDVDKIDRMGMDAEGDGVMRAVYLPTVVGDFGGTTVQGGRELAHIHGCGGMDGIAWGPDFGAGREGKEFLHIAYGIRSDLTRTDNDYQVFLQYDAEPWWDTLALPLSQEAMHKNGPAEPRHKYFAYTGNTEWGVQNMEYDAHTGDYFLCVYQGRKPHFPNYPMYVLDGSKPPVSAPLRGYDPPVAGLTLTLRDTGEREGEISGMTFPHGSAGFFAAGDGTYLVSEPFSAPSGEQGARVRRYRLDRTGEKWVFVLDGE